MLLEPTLDAVDGRGLISEIGTFHLDRGWGNNIGVRRLCADTGVDDLPVAKRRRQGRRAGAIDVPPGMRWPVERANSWLSNFGQLRRNTDRFIRQRLAQLALAITLISHDQAHQVGRPLEFHRPDPSARRAVSKLRWW